MPRRRKPGTTNEPWDVLEYQNYWNGLTEREQNNMDRAKSHLIESIRRKITKAATKYNASMLLLARLPNGTQHTNFILASGGGIDYCKKVKMVRLLNIYGNVTGTRFKVNLSN